MMRRPVLVGYAGSPAVRAGRPFYVPRTGQVMVPAPHRGPLGYRITFVLDFRSGTPRAHEDLQDLLDTLTRIDERFLREHPETPPLYQAGLTYEQEPIGEEDWLDIPCAIRRRRHVDCEDLAAWRAAELRVRAGIQARATFLPPKRKSDGGYLYHIVVRYPDGRIEDPSRVLGMV